MVEHNLSIHKIRPLQIFVPAQLFRAAQFSRGLFLPFCLIKLGGTTLREFVQMYFSLSGMGNCCTEPEQ